MHFVNFSNITGAPTQLINIKIDDRSIQEKKETKYLGMRIQNNLEFESHIKFIISKINNKIPLFYQLKDFLPKTKRIVLYNSLILPNILYGIELYAWLNILQKAQNRILKILFNLNKLANTNTLHRRNNVLKISDLAELRTLLISHRVVHYRL